MKNKIGHALKVIGWFLFSIVSFILVLSIIDFFVSEHDRGNDGGAGVVIISSIGGILSSLLFIGFGEALNLLQQTANNTKPNLLP